MNQHVKTMIDKFFADVSPWSSAYVKARLSFVGINRGAFLEILAARLNMAPVFNGKPKDKFQVGNLIAGQLELAGEVATFIQSIEAIASPDGYYLPAFGSLVLRPEENQNISVAPPDLLHADGVAQGNRLAVLTMCGARREMLAQQPQTDWTLKAAATPFDSLSELCDEYGLVSTPYSSTTLEVMAHPAIEVSTNSTIAEGRASLELRLAQNLLTSNARIGYRVIDKGVVMERGSIDGFELDWIQNWEAGFSVARVSREIPLGAAVHCIASYAGHAHHMRHVSDPNAHQSTREVVLSSVDPAGKLLRGCLTPELPLRNKAADDFESAIVWMAWVLGFAPVGFGTHAKTRDAFDVLVASPRGDFVVIECTLGLLRAESKLSKLSAREASLRKMLARSGFQHVRVLPVIVTAMTRDEVRADLSAAAETGVLVLTREDLEAAFDGDRLRFANADQLFEEALKKLAESQQPQELLLSSI